MRRDWSSLSECLSAGLTVAEIAARLEAPQRSVRSAIRALRMRGTHSKDAAVKVCQWCGAEYRAVRSDQKYCNKACRWKAAEAARLADPERGPRRLAQIKTAQSKWSKGNRRPRLYPDDPDWRKRPRRRKLLPPEEKARLRRARQQLQRARRRSSRASGCATTDQWLAKLHYWGYRCWMCGGQWEQIDHVKPVSKGGSSLASNLRPACAPCNNRKRAKWPFPTTRKALADSQSRSRDV